MKRIGIWIASLVVVMTVVAWLWLPSSVYANPGDECSGGNTCFCDDAVECCGESGCGGTAGGGCTGPNACGAQECCVGGECQADSGQCGGGLTCGGGAVLKCGPAVAGQGYFCADYPNECYASFPASFSSAPLCAGVGGNTCMQNCSCCLPTEERVCSSVTTTYNAGYVVTGGQGAGGGGPALYACANANDEWLSGVTANYWAGGDCIVDDDGIRSCRRTNTCKMCGCVPPPPADQPSCIVSGLTTVDTNDSPTYSITSSSANTVSTVIAKSPTGNQDWGPSPYVCTSTGNCSGTTTFPVAGTYWVVCNAYASGNDPKCSGNPFPPLPVGWTDCGASSRIRVRVNPACIVTPPTNLNIVAGPTLGTSATVTWTPGSGGTLQYIWVDEDQSEVWNGCPNLGDCEASFDLAAGTSSYAVTGLLPNTLYHVRIVNYLSPACNDHTDGSYTTPIVQIKGTVFNDIDNNCGGSGMAGATISLDGTGVAVNGDGTFVLNAAAGTHSLVASATGYICSTDTLCDDCAKSVTSPSVGNNFYLTTARGAWWQTQGAGVYAGGASGGTIGSDIPSSVSNPYLILKGVQAWESPAALIKASSSAPSLGAGTVNTELWMARSTYQGKKTGYEFFEKQMGVLPSQASQWSGTLDQDDCPANADFCYGLGATSTAWNVANNQKYVVLVDGDLRISDNITVESGGFLTFIVNGNVTVDPGVASIQGLYVMDGNFVTENGAGDDVQLTVSGSVAAWGDVVLGRDLGSSAVGNIASPAELFVYRSDLLVNMPEKMKTFVMQWSEVVPGTFGN